MHKSVLLEEVLTYLELKETDVVVDATLGYGGHSSEILKRIKRGFLFAFDQDQEAIAFSTNRLSTIASNYEIIKSNFVLLKKQLEMRNVSNIDKVLFDLGVSSPQLDQQERGFSFHQDALLDMRMDQTQELSAYQVINTYPYTDLVRILREYGEEKYASSIAKAIVERREETPIETTMQLVELIQTHVPFKYRRDHHPARKTFQAVRIEVNHELEVLEVALKEALELLNVGGRIAVITFHSLEDRIVKQLFKEKSELDPQFRKLPMVPTAYEPKYRVIVNLAPDQEELDENNRSRSARLRVIERIKE